jgi:hypothetical protein
MIPKFPFITAFPIGAQGKTNLVTNQVFLNAGQIIDGTTLDIRRYHSFSADEIAPGAFGMGFSSDGRLLYLKGASFPYGGYQPTKNSVVDVASGKPLLQFDGAMDHAGDLSVVRMAST